jgi:pimeloyl-ACP methyl ester carboxylesterase
MRGEFVDLGGARVYCYAFGSRGVGIPIVLIHGCFTSSHLWRELLPRLPKGHRVLVLDLLGHGRSDRPGPRAMTVAGHAERLLKLMDELRLATACLVGHGLGAAVAANVAHRSPDRVPQVALVNPSFMARDPRDVRIPASLRRLTALVPLWKRLPGDWLASALHTALLRGYANRSEGAHSLDLYLKPFRSREGRDAACAQLRALAVARGDTVDALSPARLQAQVSLILGAEDPFLAPSRVRLLLAAVDQATENRAVVHRLGGVAHVAPEEAPDRLATAIGELLAR